MSNLSGPVHPRAMSFEPAVSCHWPAAELSTRAVTECKCAASGREASLLHPVASRSLQLLSHRGMSEVWPGMRFGDFLPSTLVHIS